MEQKRLTNIEIVTEIMTFSNFGALVQVFVIDALYKHSHAVAEAPPEAFAKEHFIHPQAWQGVAREIAEKLEQHLKPVDG